MHPARIHGFSIRVAKAASQLRERVAQQGLVRSTRRLMRTLVVVTHDAGSQPARHDFATQVIELQKPVNHGLLLAHVAKLVNKRSTQLATNQDFAVAADPVEAVHDLRVASRRLRAFIDVFEPVLEPEITVRARRPLKKLTRIVRSLRDVDVQLGLLRKHLSHTTSDIEAVALEDLIATMTRLRRRELVRAQQRLRKIDVAELRFAIFAALGNVTHRLASPELNYGQFIDRALDKLAPTAGITFNSTEEFIEAEDLHETRIRLKKLRYALELFEPVLGESFGPIHSAVEHLQELLGQHHDLIALHQVFESRRCALEQVECNTLARTLQALQLRLTSDRQAVIRRLQSEPFDSHQWREVLLTTLTVNQQLAS